MVEVLLEFLANDYSTKDALLVTKKTHHCASGDGDEEVQPLRVEAIFRPFYVQRAFTGLKYAERGRAMQLGLFIQRLV